MSAAVNTARGEVGVTIGGEALTLLVTPDALCRFSAAIGAGTFRDVVGRAIGGEPVAVREGLKAFAIAGNHEKAWASVTLPEFVVFGGAMAVALTAHMGPDPGNAPGGGTQSPSPSPTTSAP
jgi:hypothetical protein